MKCTKKHVRRRTPSSRKHLKRDKHLKTYCIINANDRETITTSTENFQGENMEENEVTSSIGELFVTSK